MNKLQYYCCGVYDYDYLISSLVYCIKHQCIDMDSWQYAIAWCKRAPYDENLIYVVVQR